MRLLVTGGAGFIGSHFIRHMLSKHEPIEITCVDKLTYAGNLINLEAVLHSPVFKFVKGDISDPQQMDSLFQSGSFDHVLNFAAESHVDRSILEPDMFIRTNILGTHVLLEQSVKYGIRRFVQVSTDEVYGSLEESGCFSERSPIAPSSPYSASKASADLLALAYQKTYGLNVNVTRCTNNFGSHQFPEKLLPLVILNTLHNRKIPVYGDGLQVRDWLHVSDHCSAIEAVLNNGLSGEVYNIGGNNELSNMTIIKNILRIMNADVSLIEFVKDRPGHDRRYAIDNSKIVKELGWEPKSNFLKELEDTVEWYKNNTSWWSEIISGQYRAYYQNQYCREFNEGDEA